MKEKNDKVYNPNNISALARYLGCTTATIHNWSKGRHKQQDNGHQGTINKYELIRLGWAAKCAEQT